MVIREIWVSDIDVAELLRRILEDANRRLQPRVSLLLSTPQEERLSSAMDDVIMDLTDSDDDLDITKAVKKDLGHEDHINSLFNTVQHLNTSDLHS